MVSGPAVAFTLGLQDVTAVLELVLQGPTWLLCGHLSDCFGCAQCLPILLDPYTALWHGKGQYDSYWGEEGVKAHKAKTATGVLNAFRREESIQRLDGATLPQFLNGRKEWIPGITLVAFLSLSSKKSGASMFINM